MKQQQGIAIGMVVALLACLFAPGIPGVSADEGRAAGTDDIEYGV